MIDINKDLIQQLTDRIEAGQDTELRRWAEGLHATDIAEILDQMRLEPASYLYRLLDTEVKADVLIELDEDQRADLLSGMTAEEIAGDVMGQLDSDDATDVISELPPNKAEEVIGHLEDDERASDIRDLLNYEEGTAGAMMAKELVKVQGEWSVTRAIREIRRQAEELHQVYTVYVVDEEDRLTGRLSMKHLLLGAESTRSKIRELQKEDGIVTIQAHESSEKATMLMERYDLVALPVVDEKQKLVGRITIDDAVDSIIEDAERDYQLASGISEDVESSDDVITLTRA
ncbi:MAG: magnesium transporter, partial [Crocinitomicaceae bacterium]|nr:magnesium transporter [Crocinitomicaceae bacterium]